MMLLTTTVNVPVSIYDVMVSGYATYQELDTELSLEDTYNILEVIAVKHYNESQISKGY